MFIENSHIKNPELIATDVSNSMVYNLKHVFLIWVWICDNVQF